MERLLKETDKRERERRPGEKRREETEEGRVQESKRKREELHSMQSRAVRHARTRPLSRRIGLRDITTVASPLFVSLSLFLSLFLSWWAHLSEAHARTPYAAVFGKSDNLARQWAEGLSVFALLSNAHSRHNGSCQGACQFFSGKERKGKREGQRRVPLELRTCDQKRSKEPEGRRERERENRTRGWIKRETERI